MHPRLFFTLLNGHGGESSAETHAPFGKLFVPMETLKSKQAFAMPTIG